MGVPPNLIDGSGFLLACTRAFIKGIGGGSGVFTNISRAIHETQTVSASAGLDSTSTGLGKGKYRPDSLDSTMQDGAI